MRKILGIALSGVIAGYSALALAETIYLKPDKTVFGKILEQTNEFIRVDANVGVPVTFYRDEILRILPDESMTLPATDNRTLSVAPVNESVPPVNAVENAVAPAVDFAVEEIVPEAAPPVVVTPVLNAAVVEPAPADENALPLVAAEVPSEKSAAPAAVPAPIAQEKVFLWKVTSSRTHVYLLGSVHLGKADMFPMSVVIEDAFKESQKLVVEVDVDAQDPVAAQRLMLKKATYPKGDRLANHISSEDRTRLISLLKKYRASINQFAMMKPWYIAMSLEILQIQQLGFEAEYGVDKYFLKQAKIHKKLINELETFESQLDYLDQIPDQGKFLQYTLASLDQTEKMFKLMLSTWQKGDADAFTRIIMGDILKSRPELISIYQGLIFDRNKLMADKITKYLDDDRISFVVVGAAHLVGDQGIVALLKNSGYTVEQL